MSYLGPNVISPITIESREGSISCVEPLSSTDIHEKAGESPKASPIGFEVPTQVAKGLRWSPEVQVQAVYGGSCLSLSLVPPMSPALQKQVVHRTGVLVVSPYMGGASLVGVSRWTESPPVMVFRLSSYPNSILGSNLLPSGLVSKGKRTVTLDLVPRLVGLSFPILFLELEQPGALGLGVLGQEVNSSYSKDLFSLPREVMLMEEAADFSVGETDFSVGLPLQIIAPSASTNLAKLEEVNEVLSIETKLDISGWVRHRILGFSKLGGLSLSQHEELCITLLQRLESVMEAANVLHRKAPDSKGLSQKTRDVESYKT